MSGPNEVGEDEIARHPGLKRAREVSAQLQALHFPVVFPEVFLRERAGFDCIIGNPPWDKVLFEAQAFWVTRSPGLNALPEAQRERAIVRLRAERPDEAQLEQAEKAVRERLQAIVEAAYPNRGRGHYDFAKLFVERAVGLLNRDATLGYVLPASSLLLGGWGKLRELLFRGSDLEAAQARNKGGWLFDDVEHRYAVALLSRHRSRSEDSIATIWPGITSIATLRSVDGDGGLRLPRRVLDTLSDSVVVPWFNEPGEESIFEAMRSHPSLSGDTGWITAVHDARWDFRTSGRHHRFASRRMSDGAWRVLMTRHLAAFAIDETPAFQQYIPSPAHLGNGVVSIDGRAVLGSDHPLIVFRHPSRNDDSRTMIATALPEEGFIPNTGYVHALRHASGTSAESLLALLGFLNTFTCDWWVRRFVDRHVTAPVANNVRLPDWSSEEIATAAAVTAVLLVRRGVPELAGSRSLPVAHDGRPDTELRADLEQLAARGFGLGHRQVNLILDDFSDRPASCPATLRSAILARLS